MIYAAMTTINLVLKSLMIPFNLMAYSTAFQVLKWSWIMKMAEYK